MIKNEFMIIEDDLKTQEVLFGSIDSWSRHGNDVLLSSAVFGLSPSVTYFLFGLILIPGLSVLVTFPLLYLMLKGIPLVLKSKIQVLKIYVDNIFEKCVTEKYIFERMKPFINQLNDKVRHICEIHVPRKITADKMFIDNALKQKSSLIDRMSQYRPIQYKCEMLLGQIEILLLEYFPESKLSLKYIKNTRLEHEIGQGSFSSVQLAVIAIDSEETVVAVKTLRTALDNMYSYKQLSEALIVSKLNNGQQNIMKIYGISLSKSMGDKFLQIYMEAGFVHRDLKLENILVKGGHSVRLVDLRLSRSEENISGTVVGTPSYMASEVMSGELCGSEADIYSLGMVVYELLYYRPVFTHPMPTSPSKYESIFHTPKELEEKVLKGCPAETKVTYLPDGTIVVVFPRNMSISVESGEHLILENQHRMHFKRKIIMPGKLVHQLEWRFYKRTSKGPSRPKN
ncbi:unnamed protein product [Mytilus coruscus]|uniref:Protein kinase domain-containing protein n=1 Tax=Mytilus coruscus TaxID=42192 RepID=A0A6J8A9L4_MYTCO|nr:unnamed protein product [Mytilus coruscus]